MVPKGCTPLEVYRIGSCLKAAAVSEERARRGRELLSKAGLARVSSRPVWGLASPEFEACVAYRVDELGTALAAGSEHVLERRGRISLVRRLHPEG